MINSLFSRTSRHARQMLKHVEKILSAQRDILSADAIRNVESAMGELRGTLGAGADRQTVQGKMTGLESAANKWLKSYPNPGLRENVEVLLVAIAVAMAIRTFFVQPFKIPTGSMQPTLFGITSNPDFSRDRGFAHDLRPEKDFEIPNPLQRFFQFWFNGIGYTHVVAKSEGRLTSASEPRRFLLFNLKQTLQVGNETYTVWFPPDNMLRRAGLVDGYGVPHPKVFKPGEDVIKLRVISGDHLFVDRMTYNFRRPKLGEIIVFETKGIPPPMPQDQFYIKRLVGLGPAPVRIGNDRHIIFDGKRLDSKTPHFENVYSFDPNQPPKDSVFSGHVNETVADKFGFSPGLAPLFRDENTVFNIRPDHYIVMGDNTVNSSDSRNWGDFSRKNVIGKSFFVYWPIGRQDERSSRFGWGHR